MIKEWPRRKEGHIEGQTRKDGGMINPIQSKMEETIKNWVEDVLVSVDQWTQGLCEEVSAKIEETQLALQAVMSLNMQTKSLYEEFSTEIADTKHDIYKERNLSIQGTQVRYKQ
jgi:hypothetical protein